MIIGMIKMLTTNKSIKLGQATNIVKDIWLHSTELNPLIDDVSFESDVIRMYEILRAIEDKVDKMEKIPQQTLNLGGIQ